MKQFLSSFFSNFPFSNYLSGFSLFLIACGLYAQPAPDFSGVWIQDPAKSDDFYKSFEVNYTITQTPQVFTVRQILTMKGSTESITNEYTYTLDGKVTTMDKDNGKEMELAQWSPDKKTLTTRSTKTYGNEEVGFTEIYSLSENGLILTVQKSNIIPGALTIKQVFNRKQQ